MSADESPDPQLTETMVASDAVFDGVLLHVRRDTVRLPDGSLAKREFMSLAVDANALALMRRIKAEFDPDGILNPGKLLPQM